MSNLNPNEPPSLFACDFFGISGGHVVRCYDAARPRNPIFL